MEAQRKYSCDSPTQTLDWIKAIGDFIKPYRFFFEANVVNFFTDRLWEAVSKDWIDCLRNEPVEHLLLIPSGVVQEHWPPSLKEYVRTAKLLAYPREQAKLEKLFSGMSVTPLNNVFLQGMNPKKKHEVEILSSLISCIVRSLGVHTVVDVGAGQGYLSQVLAFQHQLHLIAIDGSSHHGVVTNTRAKRIKKHYQAKFRNPRFAKGTLNMPKIVTCRVLSSTTLRDLINYCCQQERFEYQDLNAKWFNNNSNERCEIENMTPCFSASPENADRFPLVLAGLHACGDLSVMMLRAFVECKEVKAVVSIGCCYNLLSEDGYENCGCDLGFPMSKGVKSMGFLLGKNARDLACQSAERWKGLEKDDGAQNFDVHAYRAAFQMVLERYYPAVMLMSPSIGRQGKALLRQQRKTLAKSSDFSRNGTSKENFKIDSTSDECISTKGAGLVDKFNLFEKFSYSGLCRLGVKPLPDMDMHELWRECQPVADFIGPYWSLRAALGPLLETLLLLDRLLFLQEQSGLEVVMLPIFDPSLSPRNLAIIAHKN